MAGVGVHITLFRHSLTKQPSFVEWEKAPERKRIAHELLKTKKFTAIPGMPNLHVIALPVNATFDLSSLTPIDRIPGWALAKDESHSRRTSLEGIP